MVKSLAAASLLGLLFIGAFTAETHEGTRLDDIDAFWAELSRTVAEGDYDGYAATYHEDAVLVNGMTQTSYPISQALAGWKQGFVDTKAGNVKASVEFKFSQRLSDATTAHETGIFHYSAQSADGELSESYIHFEGLLVNKAGWKMMMEYQKAPASIEEWNAIE